MRMIEPIIEELKHESAVTRKFLERVPEDKFAWKPHEKCMTLGRLASHVAESFSWTKDVVEKDGIEMDPARRERWEGKNRAEIVERFESGVSQSLDVLEGVDDEDMMKTWTFKVGDRTAFSAPRGTVLQSFIINHMIHHRAQLGFISG